jgi:hypothetical protein
MSASTAGWRGLALMVLCTATLACRQTKHLNHRLEGTASLLPCGSSQQHPPLVFTGLERLNWLDDPVLRRQQVTPTDIRSARVANVMAVAQPPTGLSGVTSVTLFVEADTFDVVEDAGTAEPLRRARVEVARSRPRSSPTEPLSFDLSGADLTSMMDQLLSVSSSVTVVGCPAGEASLKLTVDVDFEVEGDPVRRLSTNPQAP